MKSNALNVQNSVVAAGWDPSSGFTLLYNLRLCEYNLVPLRDGIHS